MIKRILLVVVFTILCFSLVICSASAQSVILPDNGMIGENLLLESDFRYNFSPTYWTYSQSYTVNANGIVLSYNGSTGFFVYRRPFSEFEAGQYTFSVYIYNVGIRSFTFSIPSSVTSNSSFAIGSWLNGYRFRIYVYANLDLGFTLDVTTNLTVSWCKLEKGANFTGYVPKSYENFGYNQGVTYGRDFERNYLYTYNNGFSKSSKYYDFTSSYYDDPENMPWRVTNGSTSFSQGTNGGLTFSTSSVAGSLSAVDVSMAVGPGSGTYTTSDVHAFYISSLTGTLTYSYTLDSVSYTYNCVRGLNIVYLSNYTSYGGYTFSLSANSSCTIKAYKQEGGSIFTLFPVTDGSSSTYESGFDSGYSSGYSDGSLAGYEQGNSAGQAVGYESGYSAGDSFGFQRGRSEGYSEGLSTAQSGTFFSLFSAIIDVPVQTLMSLLNYEFFGINLWNFARLLLTLALFLAVIHLFTKGRFKA